MSPAHQSDKEHLILQPGDIIKCQGYPQRFKVIESAPCHTHKPYNCGGKHYFVEEINPSGVLHRIFEYSQTWIDLHYQRLEITSTV